MSAPSAPGRTMMERRSPRLGSQWLGANFWSRAGGPLMWRHYDPALVREELATLHRHGLTMTRSFFYWPDFQPEPDLVDEKMCGHFADFLDAHAELGMSTIPTFLVGHMSGENWDPTWRNGRNLYRDVWMLGQEAFYIENLTARYCRHPAVGGWLISNEIPIYGGEDATDVVTAWARLMVQAVRAGGGHQPVGIGDGAWGAEVTGHDSGFSVRALGLLTDFVGPHVYRMETDIVRQHLKAAFICELAGIGGRPVVMEEFGLSSDFVSEENSAHYYRQLLYSTLLAGSVGWIAWNNTDFDQISAQRPYSHHPFELHFGITDAQGAPKPPLLELQDFARRLDAIDAIHCRRGDVQAALVVSSYLAEDYSFLEEVDRAMVADCCEQAYVGLHEAGIPVAVVREHEDGGIDRGYGLYLVPSVKALTAPSWRQLLHLARAGSTVYVSYCAGESPTQRGPWWSATEELFGVRNGLRYGLNDRVDDDIVELTFVRRFATIGKDETLRFPAAGNENSRARLPVTVTDGQVVAVDAHGDPAIVMRQHGTGAAVLCTYPIEHFASRRAAANPDDSWRLYEALAQLAGATPEVGVDRPDVLVDHLVHDDGSQYWFLMSESPEPLDCAVHCPPQTTTLSGEPVHDAHFTPYGVQILRVRPERDS